MTRETALVELVDEDGSPVGATTVAHAHSWPGLLHRAYSVLLFDGSGRMLIQQRAAVKTRFALRWGNACCGHPAPGEDVRVAAARRLEEELGLRSVELQAVGVYTYRAGDATSGRIEHEYDHVLTGQIPPETAITADPDEVADLRWVPVDDLCADLGSDPAQYAPWLPGVVSVWHAATEPTGGR